MSAAARPAATRRARGLGGVLMFAVPLGIVALLCVGAGALPLPSPTAQDLEKFRIVDGVVPEPMGGAHRDPKGAIARVGDAIEAALSGLSSMTPDELRAQRKERFYAIGREGLA